MNASGHIIPERDLERSERVRQINVIRWVRSSVGRAMPLQGMGRGFETCRIHP